MRKYSELLDEVYSALPEKKSSGERFEMPKAVCFLQGNKTVIKNFAEICDKIRREPAEVAKYLFKELATPGTVSGQQLVLQTKVPLRLIDEKLTNYVSLRVLCNECGKPDTHFDNDASGFQIVVCEACGARKPVR
ncbi:MAG: translation initiation factor IF-2 subunit beta [Candidatus Micrarchaeota archaeon]